MSRRPRRLWFGDWQHDDEPGLAQPAAADQADTVTILPDEESVRPPRPRRRRNDKPLALTLFAIAALCAFGIGLAAGGGGDKKTVASEEQIPPAQTPQAQPQIPQTPQGVPPQGFGGADLTGPAAVKAARAALAQYPGEIERVTAGPGGDGYVVHVFQADGAEVHVLISPDFKVQGSDARNGPQSFGSGPSQ